MSGRSHTYSAMGYSYTWETVEPAAPAEAAPAVPALAALRHHVSGAIERGEAEPIVAVEAEPTDEQLVAGIAKGIERGDFVVIHPGWTAAENAEILDGLYETVGSAKPSGLGGDEPAAPARVVELGGKTVPLADCNWVEWAPCGCPVGTAAGRNVATEEDAWTDFYPQEADRESAQRQGYRWELMTHDRWSAEVADRMIAGCPHVGPAAKPGTGRGPDRDKPAVPELAADSSTREPAARTAPGDRAAAPSGRSARGTRRRQPGQSPPATRGRGRR